MTMDQLSTDVPSELLLDALEALNEGIAIYDADERLVICNSRYKELLGPMQDMIEPGMHWRDLIHGCVQRGLVPDRHESGEDWISTSERQRKGYEQKTEIRQLNGRTYEISYHPTSSGGFVVTREDITERLQAEETIREREALLTTILDTNPTPIFMSRLDDGRIIYRSPAADDMLTEEDYAPAHYANPRDRERYVGELKQTGIVREMEVPLNGSGGRRLTGSISEIGELV